MRIARPLACLVVGLAVLPSAWGDAPRPGGGVAPARPVVTIRAVRPDREVEAMLGLFRGSRAANPAAALSAWKRASAEPKRLGKVGDAIIALLNPGMVREYRTLDDAEVAFSLDPTPAGWQWRARFPHDDGTLGVIGPVADLSGGGIEPPIGATRVDRFPGNTLALLARGTGGVCAASSRGQLEAAVAAAALAVPAPPIESGWLVRVDPAAAGVGGSLLVRRTAEAARATGCEAFTGRIRLVGPALVASWVGRFASGTPAVGVLEPGWLDAIPARGALAAVGLAVDPRAETWAGVFPLVDRLERVDPARASMAPARLRLALAAMAGNVRLEADVWPHLKGVVAWVGVEAATGRPDRALLALMLDDEAAARRVAAGPRATWVPDGGEEVGDLGMVAGRPLRLARRQARLFLAWGEGAWPETRAALDTPGRSARPWLALGRDDSPPSRVGALWPGQVPGLAADTPLAAALVEAPPIRWAGTNDGDRTVDEFWADGLDATIRRFLDRLPLDPPPDR